MTIEAVLRLACGLALFLFGMNVMGDSLQRAAGSSLKDMLRRMTSSPLRGFLLGLIVTAIIQSSSATTVLVVGFVNAGTLTLTQSVGIILGAELGTTVTAWLTGLSGLGSEGAAITSALSWLKPTSWLPILALVGIALLMFAKQSRKKDVARVLLGFVVLMTGMSEMSGAVSGLKSDPGFQSFFTMFENPVLGVLVGVVMTAIIQSSSASVGILQSLSVTGAIKWSMAIPIVMGQSIGTCVTALIASIGANKNGKRSAFVHLYFNLIGTLFWASAFTVVNHILAPAFFSEPINMWGIAGVFSGFKLLSLLLLFPFHRQLEKLAIITVGGVRGAKGEESVEVTPLDDRLFRTPAVAVEQAEEVTAEMARLSCGILRDSLTLFADYDEKKAEHIRRGEATADLLEDDIGSYLVRLSAKSMDESDSHIVTKLLRLIGEFERISDHAVNLLESAEEMREKKVAFSSQAQRELAVFIRAVDEIVSLAERAFLENDAEIAARVEPLEELIDNLRDRIKVNHILRLRKSECTIEHGFVLSDILTNLERVADHCSNIAGCVVELVRHNALDMHRYLDEVKSGGADFDRMYAEYEGKYILS